MKPWPTTGLKPGYNDRKWNSTSLYPTPWSGTTTHSQLLEWPKTWSISHFPLQFSFTNTLPFHCCHQPLYSLPNTVKPWSTSEKKVSNMTGNFSE